MKEPNLIDTKLYIDSTDSVAIGFLLDSMALNGMMSCKIQRLIPAAPSADGYAAYSFDLSLYAPAWVDQCIAYVLANIPAGSYVAGETADQIS